MKNSQWEESEITYLQKNYKHTKNKDMAIYLDRTKTAVDLKINRLGLKKSKYNYNQKFFKEIDTQIKAYWLGFIYADGYIVYNYDMSGGEFAIQLQKSDYKHLQKLNSALEGNVPVTFFKKICNLNKKEYESCQIRYYSINLVNDLSNQGVSQSKSLEMEFPKIQDDLMRHFIRGYFDGDGCITLDKKKKLPDVNFTSGSFNFISNLRKILFDNGINSYIYKETDKNCYRLYVRGMKNCNSFFEFIYQNSVISLDRKLNKKNKIYIENNLAQRLPL